MPIRNTRKHYAREGEGRAIPKLIKLENTRERLLKKLELKRELKKLKNEKN